MPGVWHAVERLAAELLDRGYMNGRQARLEYRAAMQEAFRQWKTTAV